MTGAFWPGLILAALSIGYWLHTDGIRWFKALQWAEECRNRQICPQCEEHLSRCTCFEDRGLL